MGAGAKTEATTSRLSTGGAGAATRARLSAKPGDETKTTPGRPSRLGASRLTSGRASVRPTTTTEKDKDPDSGAQTARVRGTSANKDDIKFGRGRQSSGSRDTDIRGLARGSSANKDKDLKFGARDRGSSKDKMALGFGKGAAEVKIDPDSTIIKKVELEELK